MNDIRRGPDTYLRSWDAIKQQRWFPRSWTSKPWDTCELIEVSGDACLLLARPQAGMPWLQIAAMREGNELTPAASNAKFWSEWLGRDIASVKTLGKEQSNSSVLLELGDGEWGIAKLFRIVTAGENPEAELLSALQKAAFPNVPKLLAAHYFAWPENKGEEFCSGTLTQFIAGAEDGFTYLTALSEPESEARTLGKLTADLHSALKNVPGPGIAPTSRLSENLKLAKQVASQEIQGIEQNLNNAACAAAASLENTDTPRQRIHGDLHLGQLLRSKTGKWTVIDFEGEPMRPLSKRRLLDLPQRDVAGMLRSLSYAANGRDTWEETARKAFLDGYFSGSHQQTSIIAALELEKALYELSYEAQFRPAMKQIPLKAVTSMAASEGARA